MSKICENTECKKEFEPQVINQKYCSSKCSNRINHLRRTGKLHTLGNIGSSPGQTALALDPPVKETKAEKPEKRTVISEIPKRERMQLPTASNVDLQTQFVFNMLNKEIDRFEDSAKDYKTKAEKLQNDNDKLRDELAKLKTDQHIADIKAQHAKPSGLSGLLDQAKGLLDNQHIGPVVADVLRGFLTGGINMNSIAQAQHVGGAEAQQDVLEIVQWYGAQAQPVQENFKQLLQAINALPDPSRIPDLLVRLVNVIKQGTSIVRSSGSASMSYGT